jgi:hypothetical protein
LNAAAADPCPKVAFKGYKHQKSAAGVDRYFNANQGITLTATCLDPDVTYDEAIEELKKESSVRNTNVDAVYFEFNIRGKFQRVYLVARQPVFKLTFSAGRKQRARLNGTQQLIEKQFKGRP